MRARHTDPNSIVGFVLGWPKAPIGLSFQDLGPLGAHFPAQRPTIEPNKTLALAKKPAK